jgi:fatty-acid desaturase
MFSPSPLKIFLVQLFSWISIVTFVYYASWPWIVLSILFYIIYAGAGVGLGFHRVLSHSSFKVNSIIRKILLVIGSFANVGSPITWVAVHRAHHRYCDTEKDPHSPKFMSFWYMMFGTMYSKVNIKFSIDLMRDPFCQFLHTYYYLLQVPWILFLFLIGGIPAVLACHIIPGGMTWLAGSLVNYLNHVKGYVDNETKDLSKNNLITGFLVMGEGWHNNHHFRPTSATTKGNWWEFDLIYWIGRLVGKPRG